MVLGAGFYAYKNIPQISSETPASKNEKVIAASQKVLEALAAKDYTKLAELSSKEGLSLNEIPNLDFKSKDITKAEISGIPNDNTVFLWGYTDGKGDEINLTRKAFIESYIYNHDYAHAPFKAVNETLGRGNSLNTIKADSVGREFAAFHFAGFNPTYEGMDWTTIYLVFDLEGGEYKLRGIAKDNWTI